MTPGPRIPTAEIRETSGTSTLPVAMPEKSHLRSILVEEALRVCLSQYGNGLRAIVLTGSLARNEATFVREANHWRMQGDADLFLVHKENVAPLSDAALQSLAADIEAGLAARQIHVHMGLASVPPQYLRRLVPRISTYELLACGQVLWGDAQVLSLIPSFKIAEIPREDAWQMLCNRFIEFLEHAAEISSATKEISPSLHYATVKLFLDTATSYLVFADSYEPTFQSRAQRLRDLANDPRANAAAPFPLKDFSDRVSVSTDWKLSGRSEDRNTHTAYCEEAMSYARRLWRWELERLTGAAPGLHNACLWIRCAQQQSALQRSRGWLSVVRRRGWHQGWRYWPRWLRLSLRATPRFWIYRAAGELLWRPPRFVEQTNEPLPRDGVWEQLRSFLPELAPNTLQGEQPWQQAARDVVWNYKEFLIGTDA